MPSLSDLERKALEEVSVAFSEHDEARLTKGQMFEKFRHTIKQAIMTAYLTGMTGQGATQVDEKGDPFDE